MKSPMEFLEEIDKCKNLEKILNSPDFELYEKNMTFLPCEDERYDFIIFFENKHYLVLCKNDYDLIVYDCFDSHLECKNYYYENYDKFHEAYASLELYENNIILLPTKKFNHFIIFFEGIYYLVTWEHNFPLQFAFSSASFSECRDFFFEEKNFKKN